MILIVTINPLLERRFYYQSLDLSSVNRNGKLIIKAGGKGINVNRQLNKLGIKNIALLFTGGPNAKLIRETLRAEKTNYSEIVSRNETRDAAIIIDQSAEKIYSFLGTESLVSSAEVGEFISKLEKAIAACEIVILSGSSPCKEANTIFAEGINIANKLDKISVCDTYGRHLQDCYDSAFSDVIADFIAVAQDLPNIQHLGQFFSYVRMDLLHDPDNVANFGVSPRKYQEHIISVSICTEIHFSAIL